MTGPVRNIRLHASTTEDGRGLLQLQRDLERAAKGADGLGESFEGAESDAKRLDMQITRTQTKIRELGEEIARTGDTTLFRDRGGQERLLAKLQSLRAEMVDEGEDIGSAVGKKITRGISSGMGHMRLGPVLIGGLVAGITPFLPMLGAMVAGAVVGTGGLLGIAGGIFAASRDPAVEAAASSFGKSISSKFFQSGSFLVEPLVQAFDILQQGYDDLNLEDTFKTLSSYVDDLAMGVAGFGSQFMGQFNRALKVAGPLVELLGRELPKVGGALGYMFREMAEGKGTLQGGLALLGFLEANLKGIGNILGWLSDRFYDFNNFMADLTGILEDVPFASDVFANTNDDIEEFIAKANVGRQVAGDVARGFQDLSQSADETAAAIRKVNDAMFDSQEAALTLDEATLRYESDLLKMKEGLDEAGTSLDRTTEKGIANRQMINGLVSDLMAERDAAIAAADGNEEKVNRANKKYQEQIKKLQELLIKLGFEPAIIEKIIGAYNRIPTRITTQIIQEYQTKGKPAGEHSGLRIGDTQRSFAIGGKTPAFEPFRVHDGETMWSTREHYVATKAESDSLMAGGGGRSGPVTVNLVLDGRVVAKALITEALNRGVSPQAVRAAYP